MSAAALVAIQKRLAAEMREATQEQLRRAVYQELARLSGRSASDATVDTSEGEGAGESVVFGVHGDDDDPGAAADRDG